MILAFITWSVALALQRDLSLCSLPAKLAKNGVFQNLETVIPIPKYVDVSKANADPLVFRVDPQTG